MLRVFYSFTDEFGQTSTLIKTFGEEVLEVTNQMELLVEEFEKFMTNVGFTEDGLMRFMEERYKQ